MTSTRCVPSQSSQIRPLIRRPSQQPFYPHRPRPLNILHRVLASHSCTILESIRSPSDDPSVPHLHTFSLHNHNDHLLNSPRIQPLRAPITSSNDRRTSLKSPLSERLRSLPDLQCAPSNFMNDLSIVGSVMLSSNRIRHRCSRACEDGYQSSRETETGRWMDPDILEERK
jgi:hypothetical protein